VKLLFSGAAILLTFAAFVPYIVSIRSGRTRPHVFSWLIWGVTTLLVFLAQRAGGAGVGAWPTAVSALITFSIAWLAFVHGADRAITTSDWLFLAGAASALPCWFLTADPLWAVLVLTVVDLLGFGPTEKEGLQRLFQEVVALPVVDDGLKFDPASVRAEDIREDNSYGGVRIRLLARLGSAEVPVQIDIGVGDAVTPAPENASFPALLDFPAPQVRTYPIHTVVAEKFETMAKLGAWQAFNPAKPPPMITTWGHSRMASSGGSSSK
jgi:hypothetical protein